MVTQEEGKRRAELRKKAEERNPLLRSGLGDLVKESQRLVFRLKEYAFCKDVLDVPLDQRDEFVKYQLIIQDINRRGGEYTKVPLELMRF